MQNRIIKIISEVKNDPSLIEKANNTSDIINELGVDSLELLNVILKVEDEFNIEIDFDEFDMDYLRSIDTFCKYLSELNKDECMNLKG